MESERVSKEFWMNNEGDVVKATGYSCAPSNKDYWWFPKLGYSSSDVYNTKESATKNAVLLCEANIKFWQKKLEILKKG